MLLFCWLYVVAVVVPKCWFSIFLSRCFISLCEKLTSFTHGYSHFVCICFASCWIVLFVYFGYYYSPSSCCNSCCRVECLFVLFLEVKGTRGFSLFLGVGQNEKSSSTSSLKCVYLCWFLCVEFLGKKVL